VRAGPIGKERPIKRANMGRRKTFPGFSEKHLDGQRTKGDGLVSLYQQKKLGVEKEKRRKGCTLGRSEKGSRARSVLPNHNVKTGGKRERKRVK